MSNFPKGSIRAAVAQRGDHWMFYDPRLLCERVAEHINDCDTIRDCSHPSMRGGDYDARAWSGVLPSEMVA